MSLHSDFGIILGQAIRLLPGRGSTVKNEANICRHLSNLTI
jgi:hypothetical protein